MKDQRNEFEKELQTSFLIQKACQEAKETIPILPKNKYYVAGENPLLSKYLKASAEYHRKQSRKGSRLVSVRFLAANGWLSCPKCKCNQWHEEARVITCLSCRTIQQKAGIRQQVLRSMQNGTHNENQNKRYAKRAALIFQRLKEYKVKSRIRRALLESYSLKKGEQPTESEKYLLRFIRKPYTLRVSDIRQYGTHSITEPIRHGVPIEWQTQEYNPLLKFIPAPHRTKEPMPPITPMPKIVQCR